MYNVSPSAALWINIGILLLAIEIVVIIHEFGHFIIAKINKVRVSEYAIGMGPTLFSFYKNGTTYSFKIFPIGGYVAVLSKQTETEIERIKNQQLTPEQIKYIHKKLHGIKLQEDFSWQTPIESIKWTKRAWFSSMGVIFNFISSFIFVYFMYLYIGKPTPTENAILLTTETNYKLSEIKALENQNNNEIFVLENYSDIKRLLSSPEYYFGEYSETNPNWRVLDDQYGNYFRMTNVIFEFTWLVKNQSTNEFEYISYVGEFEDLTPQFYTLDDSYWNFPTNNGDTQKVKVEADSWFFPVPTWDSNTSSFSVGFLSRTINNQPTFGIPSEYFYMDTELEIQYGVTALSETFVDTMQYFADAWIIIANIFSFGALSDQINSNVEIISDVNFSYWMSIIFNTIILISLVIIAFNLLPIPPLDGWKIVESFYVGIKKKEISAETQATLNKVGWAVIIVFTIAAFFAVF